MTESAALALQKACLAELRAATSLTDLLGGPHIYDHPARNQRPPYVLFTDWQETDWSSSTEGGSEHRFVLDIRTRHAGKSLAYQMAEKIRSALQEQAINPEGHHLVMLHVDNIQHRWLARRRMSQSLMRVLAFTEPAEAAGSGSS